MAGEPDSLLVSCILTFVGQTGLHPQAPPTSSLYRTPACMDEALACAGGCAHQAEQQQPQILIGKLLAGGRHRELRL